MHSDELKQRWYAMPLFDQLGNIGSEVGRAIKRKHEGNQEYADKAFDRALELFDLTLCDPKRKTYSVLREIARTREVFCDYCIGENIYASSPESFDRYFNTFSMAARNVR